MGGDVSGRTPPEGGGRGALGILLDPVFGPYFAVKTLSTAGIWIYNIVAAILAFELSGSALVVGILSVAQFGPQLLFAPLTGAMADRGDRKRLLAAGKLLVAAASGGLSVWLWLVGPAGLPGVAPLILAGFVVGVGFVLVGPAQNAIVPALVEPEELAAAVALNSIPPTLARAVGPAIGALVATSLGPAAAFAITAVTNLVFVIVILSLSFRGRATSSPGADFRIRIGVRRLREDRRLFFLLLGVGAIGVASDPVITLTPSLASAFDGGSHLVGLLATSFGVGAGIGFLALERARIRFGLVRLATAGLALLSGGLAATGISPSSEVAMVSLLAAGIGMAMALSSLTTQIQERLPDEIRGRVMALWSVAFIGSRPAAALVNGSVADATSPGLAFVLVAVLPALVAWICRGSDAAASAVAVKRIGRSQCPQDFG